MVPGYASSPVGPKLSVKAVIDFKVDGRQLYILLQGHDAADFRDYAGVNANNSKCARLGPVPRHAGIPE